MTKKVIIPLPNHDFDPTESAIPWKLLCEAGVEVTFATESGRPGRADPIMLTGKGLGIFSSLLAADKNAARAYSEMVKSKEFLNPITWNQIDPHLYDGVILPGGHAKGMRPYLESEILQEHVVTFFKTHKKVGAICHGVVLAARSKDENGQSILAGRKTTALLATQEILAWLLTFLWLGTYYRTYTQTVQNEVQASLSSANDFISGPLPLSRDRQSNLGAGFVVQDGNYISARWPGDAHLFANKFIDLLKNPS